MWLTFNHFDGMFPAPSDNWDEGRCMTPYLAIMKDANIEVSNGTVKLKVIKEPCTWQCATCGGPTYNTSYSIGFLNTPYPMSFNAGKFEARLKMPVFNYAWSGFWLWKGTLVDEIDIAEGFGRSSSFFAGGYPQVSHSIHAWDPPLGKPNPYNMIHDKVTEYYPNQTWYQTWWQWNANRPHFQPSEFHTYTCEWDTAKVAFYLDGTEVNTYYKYFQSVCHWTWYSFWRSCTHYNIYPSCTPSAGTYKVFRGFPYNNQSESKLILGPGLSKVDGDRGPGFVDQMEVDYVKIWEKHPEHGWVGCNEQQISLNGPSLLCASGTATYTVSPAIPGGTWSTAGLSVVSSTATSVTVTPNSGTPTGQYEIQYTAPNLCNANTTAGAKVFVDNGGLANVVHTNVVEANFPGRFVVYYLNATPPVILLFQTLTYTWDYTSSNFPGHTFHTQGQNAAFVVGNVSAGLQTFNWTLHISDDCGTVTKTGQLQKLLFKTTDTVNLLDPDTANFYYTANLTDSASADSFFTAVQYRCAQLFFADTATDTTIINSELTRIEIEELAPYIVIDSNYINNINRHNTGVNNLNSSTKTKLYPNPTTRMMNVDLGSSFKNGNVDIGIYDILGKAYLTENKNHSLNNVISLNCSEVPKGVYILEIRQNSTIERLKLVKD